MAILHKTIAAGFGILLAGSAMADELIYIPSVAVQVKNLEFNQVINEPNNITTSGGLSVDIPVLQYGITAIYGNFFGALKFESALTDSVTDSDVPYTTIPGKTTLAKVDRNDLILNLGYSISPGFSVFGGFMQGKTNLLPSPNSSGVLASLENNNVSSLNLNLAQAAAERGEAKYEQEYIEKGFFLGSSYSYTLEGLGSITASAAYAMLDGEYSDNFSPATNENFEFSGDTTGTSLALSWSAPISDNVGYYLDIRMQSYDMDGKDSNGNFTGYSVDTEENITSLTAGIRATIY